MLYTFNNYSINGLVDGQKITYFDNQIIVLVIFKQKIYKGFGLLIIWKMSPWALRHKQKKHFPLFSDIL